MLIYILLFAVFFYYYAAGKRMSKETLAIIIIVMTLIVGLADMMGGFDRYIYGYNFDDLADRIGRGDGLGDAAIQSYRSEFGYYLLNMLLAHFTDNRYIFILILTIIIYALLFQSFKQYTRNYPVAMMLFMGLWFFFTWTYLREVIAASVGFLGYRYIVDRDWKRFALIVFIAFSFHHSALILAPAYFLPVKKLPTNKVWIVFVVVFVLGFSPVPGAIASLFADVSDERVGGMAGELSNGGFRWDYLLESFLFTWVITKNYNSIPNTRRDVTMMNIGLGFCFLLMLFGRSTSGGRLGWYYLMGVIMTLTQIATNTRISSVRNFIVILSFLLFVRLLNVMEPLITPYKTFFTPGHTCNDVYSYSEYDFNYDKNKFYRPVLWLKW